MISKIRGLRGTTPGWRLLFSSATFNDCFLFCCFTLIITQTISAFSKNRKLCYQVVVLITTPLYCVSPDVDYDTLTASEAQNSPHIVSPELHNLGLKGWMRILTTAQNCTEQQQSPAASEKWHPYLCTYELLLNNKAGLFWMSDDCARFYLAVQRCSMCCGFLQITRNASAAHTHIRMNTHCLFVSADERSGWTAASDNKDALKSEWAQNGKLSRKYVQLFYQKVLCPENDTWYYYILLKDSVIWIKFAYLSLSFIQLVKRYLTFHTWRHFV